MGALVTVSLPCAAVEALMSLDGGRLSGQVRRAVEAVLSSGRPCPPPTWPPCLTWLGRLWVTARSTSTGA